MELAVYYTKHGHSIVPNVKSTLCPLARWVGTQRIRYKEQKQGKLFKVYPSMDERIRLLNELHFIWDVPEVMWRIKYRCLEEHAKKHGPGSFINDTTIRK
jgi:hypothetical protein